MKRNSKFILFAFSLIVMLSVMFSNGIFVRANTSSYDNQNSIKQSNVITSTIELTDRYSVLDDATLPEDENDIGGYITSVSDALLTDMLLKIYKNYDSRYTSNYLRVNMFQNFTMLDLSNIVQGTSNVVDLAGIKYLNFENLQVLKLNNNNIEKFDMTYLPGVKAQDNDDGTVSYIIDSASPVKKLTTLDLSENNLSGTLDVTHFEKLVNLNIANNMFEKVLFARTQESACVLDYSNNKIQQFSNITLPQYGLTTLILFGNPIENIENIPTNITLEIGLLNLTSYTTSSTKIKYVPFVTLDMNIKIYSKIVGENDAVTYQEYPFTPDAQTNEFTLPAGNYKVTYVDNDSGNEIKSNEFTIKPPIATYLFKINGEITTTKPSKFTKKSEIIFSTPSENIKVYYRYSNYENWIEGNVCDLTKKSGTYGVAFKTVENGIESIINTINVQVSYSKFVPDIVIVFIIILVIVFLALVVVPLLRKLLDKISKNS